MPDYIFENHGSIWLCRPMRPAARNWLYSHVGDEAQLWGDAIVVEPRYVENLARQLEADGFTVESA